jgi:hypothetical protein
MEAAIRLRKRAFVAFVMGGLALLALIIALGAWSNAQSERDRAERQARASAAQRLATQAGSLLSTNPQRSLLLAAEAINVTSQDHIIVTEAEQALRNGLRNSTGYGLSGHEGIVQAVAISPDNHWLVTGSGDTTARLWDLTGPIRPFGGVKNSGYGRELSDLGIGEFVNKTLIHVA